MSDYLPGIDINGLDPKDRATIGRIGLWAWMRAVSAREETRKVIPPKARKIRRTCTICGDPFYSRRQDAAFCSANCRAAASRSTRREMSQITVANR